MTCSTHVRSTHSSSNPVEDRPVRGGRYHPSWPSAFHNQAVTRCAIYNRPIIVLSTDSRGRWQPETSSAPQKKPHGRIRRALPRQRHRRLTTSRRCERSRLKRHRGMNRRTDEIDSTRIKQIQHQIDMTQATWRQFGNILKYPSPRRDGYFNSLLVSCPVTSLMNEIVQRVSAGVGALALTPAQSSSGK